MCGALDLVGRQETLHMMPTEQDPAFRDNSMLELRKKQANSEITWSIQKKAWFRSSGGGHPLTA
jgi:hypothetical protein